jgi:tRNA1(Val) A37 N6-methylase TrmN6
MTDKNTLQTLINQFSGGDLRTNALALFKELGYQSPRTFNKPVAEILRGFDHEKSLCSEWINAPFLFQLAQDNLSNIQSLLTEVDGTIIESYMFVAIELEKSEYSRTQLVTITRELNKSPQPVLILFKHGDTLTLSVIHRRLHKRDESKDVLEKVTLLKDIRISDPHRAHVDILADLAFDNLKLKANASFVDLHNAWQSVLDTKTLNKQFYKELSQWYFWAMKEVYFPDAENIEAIKGGVFEDENKVREHNAKNLIRLLTRLLFVWFIKEKNLIPEQLFQEDWINAQLDDFKPQISDKSNATFQANDSHYYRAILQNLFFATLNQTCDKRGFRNDGKHRNVTNLMRYKSYFKEPESFLTLMKEIVPFMNGGLFDCLDKVVPDLKGKQGGDVIAYEDGFSDRPDNKLRVPDYIFFGKHEKVDLSEELGNKQKSVEIKGLIDILKSYKFTITENTPIEEDIALDPELLGQVFENLLASYNPETKTTARKQTGSFYTPREIVDYMVDESLKAYFKSKLDYLTAEQLDDLLSYTKATPEFSESEKTALIEAIDTCKILDPACGSGAFPMGVLHKLVFILGKIDPDNELWKQRQIKEKDSALQKRINLAFSDYEVDYARKLYLIENCIYGVDIQAIAIQISKLRFFISLIVDQKVDRNKTNFGVLPLPNLETKFVAANTLIGIEKPKAQISLFDNKEIEALEEKLKKVRHSLFSVRSPSRKRELREEDKQLREQIGALLEQHGWGNETAQQLAHWNPYDQNANADFFDVEWMFGENGFDIVIGNPPYVISNDKKLKARYAESVYGRSNLYGFFIHVSIESLMNENGILSFINPKTILADAYFSGLRKFILNHTKISQILDINNRKDVFENVLQSVIVNFYTKKSEKTKVKNISTKDEILLNNHIFISQEDMIFDDKNTSIFIVSRHPETYKIFKRLKDFPSFQEAGIKFTTGKIQWDLYKKYLSDSPANDCTQLIWAENIQRFFLQPAKLRADKIYLNTSIDDKILINHQTIVVQRTTAVEQSYRIIATIIDPLSFGYSIQTENNTSYIEKTNPDLDLKFILSLLNSRFYDFIFRHINSNTHVSGGELNSLPIPKIPETEQQPFIELVDKILADKKAGNDTSAMEREIDVLVYGLYGLSDEEILIVEGGK